jgi:hypothetical protein
MNASENLDWFALEHLYYEGCRLFMRGEYDQAIDQFKRIYENTTDLWDVADLIEGYYVLPSNQWVIKYRSRIQTRLLPTKPIRPMAAGGLFRRLWMRSSAAIVRFFR